MPHLSGIITLMTDFGDSDIFVGVMKGVIASINADARVIDLTHKIAHFDTESAADLLRDAYPYFPKGTVHVMVVDPVVGTERDILAAEAGGHFFLAPDTGALWPILHDHPDARVARVTNTEYFLPKVSKTFHGRDIFAPVAAHLSLGVGITILGPVAEDFLRSGAPDPEPLPGGGARGVVTRFDAFGNAITNIPGEMVGTGNLVIRVADQTILGIRPTFGAVEPGQAVAIVGSFGRVEICVNRASAREMLGIERGAPVEIYPEERVA